MSDHLFVMDPLDTIDPGHDTTYVIMREVQNRGGEVWVCQSSDLHVSGGSLSTTSRRVQIKSTQNPFSIETESTGPVTEFDRIWMREDPPFDQAYLHATYMLSQSPVPVLNDPDGIRATNEKLFILEFPDHIPPTWVGSRPAAAMKFLNRVGSAVAKTLSGYGGEEVYRLGEGAANPDYTLRELTDDGERTIMLQKFIPSVTETGDRRIIVLGGDPIGGLTRLPANGDFRANLHAGGSAGDVYLTETERTICEDLKPELLRRGLYLVGLDLIDDRIVEINVTSPTCVQEINPHMPEPLEKQIVSYAEEHVTRRIDSYVG